jgi:hypothetical protein
MALAISGTNLFAGTWGGGVFLLTNNGTSWTPVNTGLPNKPVGALAVKGTNLFAGTGSGVFLSTDNGGNWILAGTPFSGFSEMLSVGTNLFAGTRSGVFLSTDNGTSWTPVNTGLLDSNVMALAISGTNLFAGTDTGVFLSTNNGTNWSDISAGLPRGFYGIITVGALAVDGTNLFAGSSGRGLKAYHESGRGVFLSTDFGTNWAAVNNGLTDTSVSALAISGTNLIAGTAHPGWDAGGGVFLSTNSGASWTQTNLQGHGVLSFAVSGSSLFAGAWLGGVFLSTNNGTSWTQVNTGLLDTIATALAISGTNLFAGTYSGVWRRPLSEMITSVEESEARLPSPFTLGQNSPNPFNPTTTIRYGLLKASHVTLTVYNMLGQQVAQLVDEQHQAGYHDVVFRGDGLASGVYFYRIQAGDFVASKKLLLLK